MASKSKLITRKVRGEPSPRLQQIGGTEPTNSLEINDDWLNTVGSGDVWNEEEEIQDVLDKHLDDEEYPQDYSEDEFEEEEEEEEQEEEENKEEEERIVYGYYKLNDTLSVTLPDVDNHLLNEKITIISWDGNDRMKLGQSLQLEADEDTISDVYHFSPEGLFVDTNWTLHIKVKLPRTVIACTELFHFFLLVKVDKKWQRIESQYNKSESTIAAKLTVCTIEDIAAITKRISERVNVTKNGFSFVSIKDSRIQVDFPEGSVDHEKEFQFQIIPIDLNRFQAYKAYNPRVFNCIYTMSDVLSVKYDHNRNFNKDVRVQLPVIDTTDTNGIPMFVQFNGNEVNITHDILSELDNGVLSTAVEHFSDVAMLRVDPSSSESDISSIVSIVSGKEDYCTFITFVTYQILKTHPSIWIECVDSLIAEEVAKKRKSENNVTELALSRSPDMSVLRKERIRIELGGNVDYPRGIGRDCFYMTYDKFAKRNHFAFPLVKRGAMGAPPYGAITYKCCGSKTHHVVHFNSDFPIKNLLQNGILSGIKRSNTMYGIPKTAGPKRSNTTMPSIRKTTSMNNFLQIPEQKAQVQRNSFPDIFQKVNALNGSTTKIYPSENSNNNGERNNNITIITKQISRAMTNLSTPGQQETNNNIETINLDYKKHTETDQQDPMFTDRSMLMLSQQFDDNFFCLLSICLGIKMDQWKLFRSQAINNNQPPNCMVLLEWLKNTAPGDSI